jgi:hypothetical protein
VQLGGTNSFEARVTASNVFNTVQYSGINTTENSATFRRGDQRGGDAQPAGAGAVQVLDRQS